MSCKCRNPMLPFSKQHSVVCKLHKVHETALSQVVQKLCEEAGVACQLQRAWHASRGGSLLAAQCLVEAALQLHFNGTSFTEIQVGGIDYFVCYGHKVEDGVQDLESETHAQGLPSW
eukprot:431709-Pelagomonas_calceolata.AAC.1